MRIPGRCGGCVATGTLAAWIRKGTYGQPEVVSTSDRRSQGETHRIVVALRVQRGRVLEFARYGSHEELEPFAGKSARFIVEQCLFCLTSDAVQLSKLK